MLINFRNAMMAGRRLPYDAEVKYLQSSGTQYIDTLVNADSNLSVEITMANAGTPWTNVNPIGAILATPRCRHHIGFNYTINFNGINYYLGNGDDCFAKSGYRPTDGEVFTFKVDAISKTFTLGSFLGTFPNDTFDTGLSYWLFGRNGTTPPYLGSLRICSAKLWNGSVLVRDYIPVRKGNVGYLYDRVSGKLFGNAGTGDFVCGPDVVPVEYIESHGTEWIATGVKVADPSTISISVDSDGVTPFGVIHNNAAAGSWLGVNYRTSATEVAVYSKDFNSRGLFEFSAGRHTFKWDGATGFLIDGVSKSSFVATVGTDAIGSISWPLFGRYDFAYGSVSGLGSSRFYGANIEISYAQTRRYLPVRVGTEGAMMDTLTRRIYRNAGTGAFGYGNDLKYPIPA